MFAHGLHLEGGLTQQDDLLVSVRQPPRQLLRADGHQTESYPRSMTSVSGDPLAFARNLARHDDCSSVVRADDVSSSAPPKSPFAMRDGGGSTRAGRPHDRPQRD